MGAKWYFYDSFVVYADNVLKKLAQMILNQPISHIYE